MYWHYIKTSHRYFLKSSISTNFHQRLIMFIKIGRRFSTVSTRLSELKPPVQLFHQEDKVRNFDSNFPAQAQKKKIWQEEGISKDEFFRRKYSFMSDERKSKLVAKTERQKRGRAMKESYLGESSGSQRGRISRGMIRNPLSEYIYGTHSVLAALTAKKRHSFDRIYVHNLKNPAILKLAKEYGLRVIEKATKGDLNRLCDNGIHNGVVLETRPLELPIISDLGVCNPTNGEYEISIFNDLYNTEVKMEKFVSRSMSSASQGKFPLGLYLDGVTDPHNIGAIVRSAYYLGVDFIVLPSHDTARLGPVANKASAGTLDLMSIYKTEDSFDFVDKVKTNGWTVVAASSKPNENEASHLKSKHKKVEESLVSRFMDPSSLSTVLSQSPVLLVIGSEGEGVRTNLKLRSDFLVGLSKGREAPDSIVDSLNVSVAVGILLSFCFS